ncbi:adenosine deaminase family protein [Ramlibacter humi]|uniref:Adenosine deaminase n=1 Tax=Ramlibacter humi TaxID=2530451 RepID=A0A4Z0BIA3_9BURK|nr:adenosine deaminase [Ramlibacter humi]TFY99042.1 adenosine deaminase [Ramlibacter humi]
MTQAPALEQFLRSIPKVELHCHLFGAVREQTFRDLNRNAGAPLADEEITSFYTRGEKPVGVLRVLRALDASLVRSPQDLHRMAYEYLQDAAAHNVRHSEFSWNPTGTVHVSGIPYAAAQDGIVQAIRDARRDFGISARLIGAIDREAGPEASLEMVRWLLDHRCEEVAGIGIDYRENEHPPELFEAAYALARQGGLKTTAHASEFGLPWHNVRTAVETLKVDRIDHGYTVVDNPQYAAECARRGLVFTVVPTNSYYLRTLPPERWALDHPIRRMPALGLRIHPNTDDPTLHKVDPTGAWRMMVSDFGFTLDDLRGFMLNGIDGAWLDESVKQRWRVEWPAEFDALRRQHLQDL